MVVAMIPYQGLAVALACIASLGASLFAAESPKSEPVLLFDKPIQHYQPGVTETTVAGIFTFTNASSRRVAVSAHPTCSCTAIAFDQQSYEPGQRGVLSALYVIGLYGGHVIRPIEFTTDHPDLAQGTVTMDIRLPPAPIFDTALQTWSFSETGHAKVFRIARTPVWQHAITALHVSDPIFAAELSGDSDGKGFTVTVTPAPTNHPLSAALELQTDTGRVYQLQLNIYGGKE